MTKIGVFTTYYHPISLTDPEFQQESSYLLCQQLQQAGYDVSAHRYADIAWHFTQGKIEASIDGRSLAEYDGLVFRSVTQLHEHNLSHGYLAQLLALYAAQHQIPTLNGTHLTQFAPEFNKLFQMYFLTAHDVPVPTTWTGANGPVLFQADNQSLIVKPIMGSHGNNIMLAAELHDVPETFFLDHLAQELLPNKTDFRILVLGGSCLGVMRRRAQGDKLVSNFSAGGSVEQAELTPEMQQLAEKIAGLFQLDFCGVDMMETADGQLRVLEVNRFPEFIGFQKATGIEVAAKVAAWVQQQIPLTTT